MPESASIRPGPRINYELMQKIEILRQIVDSGLVVVVRAEVLRNLRHGL